jgi:hypothetical protein
MRYFIQAIEYNMNLHAKIQGLIIHGFLYITSLSFAFLEFYIVQ